MTIRFQISGATTAIPGVYSTFLVSPSLLAPASPTRDVVILGEASSGAPGSEVNLAGMFFTDFNSLKDYYETGDVVDAAAQIFKKQPSQIFGGAVNRLYVYKTNNSTRAEKLISAPSNYGALVASRFGERGNQIKSQIVDGQAEALPSKTVNYLPSSVTRSFRVGVNGVVTGSMSVAADGTATDFIYYLSDATDLSATGGASHVSITSDPMVANITGASGSDTITITKASGGATWGATVAKGDSAYIQDGSDLAGTADINAGSYIVQSVSSTVLVIKKIKSTGASGEKNFTGFEALSAVSIAVGDIKINAPVTLTVLTAPPRGVAASLELLENASNKLAAGMIVANSELVNILIDSTSSLANIVATVPSAGKLKISISSGSWTTIPKAGDLISIAPGGQLTDSSLNVGLMIVESATSQTITASHLFSGMTTVATDSTSLDGNNSPFQYAPGFVTTTLAARRLDSSAERKVQVIAGRSSDGASVPLDLIGGNVALEVGYYEATATAASLTMTPQKVLTITPTGTGLSTISVQMRKYATLQELVDFLNTQANVFARVPDARQKSNSPNTLDVVSGMSILEASPLPAYVGRIKKDYYDWKSFFDNNFALLAFREGGMAYKSGLPTAEAVASFLTGATLGGTSNASVQDGLDAALKVDARLVGTLFSRDATKDIDDGLTDTSSNYTIASINAGFKGHISTASDDLVGKERFGECSFDGSFADSIQAAADLSYERLQMSFERVRATGADGSLKNFLPWMGSVTLMAARCQAVLGTSLLRKPLLLSDAYHVGDVSLYSDTLAQDFDANDRGQLATAIEAGLVCLRAVNGFGVRMESPDLSTRSRTSDPTSWCYERVNVLFTCDEVLQSVRQVLENYIGNRTSDTPTAVIKTAIEQVLSTFIGGALLSAQVTGIKSLGNSYAATFKFTPVECLEAITLTATATRQTA